MGGGKQFDLFENAQILAYDDKMFLIEKLQEY